MPRPIASTLLVAVAAAVLLAGAPAPAAASARIRTEGPPANAAAAVGVPHRELTTTQLAVAESTAAAAGTVQQYVPQWLNGTVVGTITALEGENFTSTAPPTPPGNATAWQPHYWYDSYFASTLTNVFHSRRGYISAPAAATPADTAAATATVASTGTYTVLVRYEALFRFEMPFLLTISSGSKAVFSRVYGYRDNLKVWGFAQSRYGLYGAGGGTLCESGLVSECLWPWGATENMVWEGVGATVSLAAGTAYTVTLSAVNSTTAHTDPELLAFADRNVDVVALVPNAQDIEQRLVYEYMVLALDGMLSQAGEVFFKVTNTGGPAFNLSIPYAYSHSPYFGTLMVRPVQQYKTGHWVSTCNFRGGAGCDKIAVPASGGSTDWVDVGAMLDTFNHGSWNLQAGMYSVTVGVKGPGEATPTAVGTFASNNASLQLLYDPSTRATRRMRGRAADFWTLKAELDAQTPTLHGKLKTLTPTYATIYTPTVPNGGGSSSSTCPHCGTDYAAAQKQFAGMFNTQSRACVWPCDPSEIDETMGYVDLRGAIGSQQKLEAALAAMKNASVTTRVTAVSLGDEITVAGGNTSDATFAQWCAQQKLTPADVGCSSFASCHVNTSIAITGTAATDARFYYSTRFVHDQALGRFKAATAAITAALPNAKVGANFSPTDYIVDPRVHQQYCNAYLGVTYQWIRLFREGGMTLPWSEDWTWQTPIGSQQMVTLMVDVMRSSVTKHATFPLHDPYGPAGRPDLHPPTNAAAGDGVVAGGEGVPYKRLPLPSTDAGTNMPSVAADPLMMYVMAHFPGNTPKSWRRQFYGDIAHGIKWFDLFEFIPSWSGYTCDYVDGDGGSYQGIRTALNELGTFEDIVQAGAAQAAPVAGGTAVALLYSESADMWMSPVFTFGAAKRTLYTALRHAHLPVDIVSEDDVAAGALNHYSVLYVVDQQVSEAAVAGIAAWVNTGGRAVFTAGAALQNEVNATGVAMAKLLPVTQSGLWTGTRYSRDNATIYYAKQDLPWAEELDVVTVLANFKHEAATLGVYGHKSVFTFKPAATDKYNVTGVFSDGSPAVVDVARGKGVVTYAGLHPGFSYFHPALPMWPTDRGTTDEHYNHWVPTAFNAGARQWIASPTADVPGAVPVSVSSPLVEVGVVVGATATATTAAAGAGIVLPIIDWTGGTAGVGGGYGPDGESTRVNITLNFPATFTSATAASGTAVNVTADKTGFSIDVDVADAIILR